MRRLATHSNRGANSGAFIREDYVVISVRRARLVLMLGVDGGVAA